MCIKLEMVPLRFSSFVEVTFTLILQNLNGQILNVHRVKLDKEF